MGSAVNVAFVVLGEVMADASGEGSVFIRCMRDIRGAFYAQRSTILISLAAAYVLAFPAVTREVYRILADDAYDLTSLEPRQIVARGITWLPIAFAFLSLFLASAAIWYVGRDLAGQVEGEQLRARTVKGYLLRWLPAVFALLLPLGAAWGLYSASLDAQAIGALQYNVAPPFDFEYPSPMADTQKSVQRLLGSMGAVAWLIRGAAYACVGLAVVLLASMALIGWRRRGSAFGARLRYGLLIVAAGIVALFSLSIAVPSSRRGAALGRHGCGIQPLHCCPHFVCRVWHPHQRPLRHSCAADRDRALRWCFPCSTSTTTMSFSRSKPSRRGASGGVHRTSSMSGSNRGPISPHIRPSRILCSSCRRPAAASTRLTIRRGFWRASRTIARILPSTSLPSAAFPVAASVRPYLPAC